MNGAVAPVAVALPPWVLDAILLLIVIEFVALSAWLKRRGAGHLRATLALYLASGAGLIAALRLVLAEATHGGVALALLVSLFAHAATLTQFVRLFGGPAKPMREAVVGSGPAGL